MNEYILLMHDDIPVREDQEPTLEWEPYLARLRSGGNFAGGSSMGKGTCLRKSGPAPGITAHLSGYLRVQADSLEAAQSLVAGNPVYEAGGTVEIRELPRS
jgi:hypothetical protein